MDNPFKKRATEFIQDPRVFLPLTSAKPFEEFMRNRQELFEKLSVVVGTPGCGKTTIAHLLEYETLHALCSDPELNKELAVVLQKNKILRADAPAILTYRLAMTTNFRSIWDLPYSEALRIKLLRAFVQSKAVLGWCRQLQRSGVDLAAIRVLLRDGSDAAAQVMRTQSAATMQEYAKVIELAVFQVVTALVAPTEEEMARDVINNGYDIFEVLKGFEVHGKDGILKPMIIIDDAHELHPTQFVHLRDWLKSRVITSAKWIMCRPDVVSPEDFRFALEKETAEESERAPGTSHERDYVIKLMQLGSRESRRFSLVARDISKRYLSLMPEFARFRSDLGGFLDSEQAHLPEGETRQLRDEVIKLANDSRFSDALVDSLKARIPTRLPDDESLATLRILLHRERNRTPQLDLIGSQVKEEPDTLDRTAKADLVDGARIQLMHQYQRPYYYGSEKLIGASNANIEQFITLTSRLIDELTAQIVRGRTPKLTPRNQQRALRAQADAVMAEWDFPYHVAVKALTNAIAARCLEKTRLPNAPLDDGANAIGIPQEEMDKVLQRSDRLPRILHFAFAYKALVFVPQYRCKNRVWCLLELGAIPCLVHGLTLRRGGFVEDTLTGLDNLTHGVR